MPLKKEQKNTEKINRQAEAPFKQHPDHMLDGFVIGYFFTKYPQSQQAVSLRSDKVGLPFSRACVRKSTGVSLEKGCAAKRAQINLIYYTRVYLRVNMAV